MPGKITWSVNLLSLTAEHLFRAVAAEVERSYRAAEGAGHSFPAAEGVERSFHVGEAVEHSFRVEEVAGNLFPVVVRLSISAGRLFLVLTHRSRDAL
jgi:hypothetical protein